ncbi:hypothetical protein PFX98_08440 [Paucibacter sediminis]|uniref:Solute-binding protein family 3/N-terminal domain-containing protein n=1 Tax=Paucibacter sediminis TaxID=3019553 RepID=A0AA95NP94_9BURK|nr:hypothetical protein [Paucibacter sp. S2-9]WIT13631.1 hypothetical protein PFX98_08440 [Paucibacter sp. S2-9]
MSIWAYLEGAGVQLLRMVLLSGLMLFGMAATAACPERIRVVFTDSSYEPLIAGRDSHFAEPPGLLVSWTRQALQRMGCLERAELLRQPQVRTRRLITEKPARVDLVVGVFEGSPFSPLVEFPPIDHRPERDLSVGELDIALYARRDSDPVWDGRTLRLAPGQTVGALRDTVFGAIAEAHGWPTTDALTTENALQMLLARRTSYLLTYAGFADARMRADGQLAAQLVKLAPPVDRRRLYAVASHDFLRAEPAFVKRFWVEMCLQGNALRDAPFKCLPPPAT